MIKMLESYPLGVMLWVCLGIDLALGDLVNELGRNLDIMIDEECESIGGSFPQAHYEHDTHRIDAQVRRWRLGAGRIREYIVYPVTFGMSSFKSPRQLKCISFGPWPRSMYV